MGLMTGLMLGSMVYGAVQARRQANAAKKAEAPPLAPPPQPGPASMTPPAPPLLDPSGNRVLAKGAALKQRRKAIGGSILTRPTAPASNAMPVPARTMPRSLIGGY